MLLLIILIAAFTCFAFPAQPEIRSSADQVIVDNFDGAGAGPVPVLTAPIGELNGLVYSNWVYGSSEGPSGVQAKSGNNTATIGIVKYLTGDVTGLYINANITKAASIKYFDLLDLYYGCRLYTATPIAGTAQQCTLSATGVDWQGNAIPEETFTYVPVGTGILGSTVDAPMGYNAFPNFRKLVSVNIRLASSSSSLASVMLLDDVRHRNYYP